MRSLKSKRTTESFGASLCSSLNSRMKLTSCHDPDRNSFYRMDTATVVQVSRSKYLGMNQFCIVLVVPNSVAFRQGAVLGLCLYNASEFYSGDGYHLSRNGGQHPWHEASGMSGKAASRFSSTRSTPNLCVRWAQGPRTLLRKSIPVSATI